jgi:hypothetical protein
MGEAKQDNKYKSILKKFDDEVGTIDELDLFTQFFLNNSGPSVLDVATPAIELLEEIEEFKIETFSLSGIFVQASVNAGCERTLEIIGKALGVDKAKFEDFLFNLESQAEENKELFKLNYSEELNKAIDDFKIALEKSWNEEEK